jgi:hypothetical protein
MRRRRPAQAIVVAAVAMVAVVGGLAMVIDAGMFFVIQRQLQAAADAGALAGAWYQPVCAAASGVPACKTFAASDPPWPAQIVGQEVAMANTATISGLCVGGATVPTPTVGTPSGPAPGLNFPQRVNWIVVTAECDAPYTFGRILGLITPRHITASSAAVIGDRDVNGDITDFTDTPATNPKVDPACPGNPPAIPGNQDKCRVARLIE